MITGKFRTAGMVRFPELPREALFVLKMSKEDLHLGRVYWVEEGLLAAGPREGADDVHVYRKRKRRKKYCNATDLADGKEGLILEDWWVVRLVETSGRGLVWMELDMEVSITTFGQLPVNSLFIRARDLRMYAPVVWKKRDAEGAVAISGCTVGAYRDGIQCNSLERVKPVREDNLIRIPELHH